jgi:hypothetical protein
MLYDNEFDVHLSFIFIQYGCHGSLVIAQNKLLQHYVIQKGGFPTALADIKIHRTF